MKSAAAVRRGYADSAASRAYRAVISTCWPGRSPLADWWRRRPRCPRGSRNRVARAMTGPCSNGESDDLVAGCSRARGPARRGPRRSRAAKAVDQSSPSSPATGASSAACRCAPVLRQRRDGQRSLAASANCCRPRWPSGGCRRRDRCARGTSDALRRRASRNVSSSRRVRRLRRPHRPARGHEAPSWLRPCAEYVTPPPSFQPRGSSGAMSRVAAPTTTKGRSSRSSSILGSDISHRRNRVLLRAVRVGRRDLCQPAARARRRV